MMLYDVLLQRINHDFKKETKWVRGIKANTLHEAEQKALKRVKQPSGWNMSMGWSVWLANPRKSI